MLAEPAIGWQCDSEQLHWETPASVIDQLLTVTRLPVFFFLRGPLVPLRRLDPLPAAPRVDLDFLRARHFGCRDFLRRSTGFSSTADSCSFASGFRVMARNSCEPIGAFSVGTR